MFEILNNVIPGTKIGWTQTVWTVTDMHRAGRIYCESDTGGAWIPKTERVKILK